MKDQRIKIVKDESSEVLVSKIEVATAELVIEATEVAKMIGGARFEVDSIVPEYHYSQNDKEYSCMIVVTLRYKESEKWIARHK